MRVTFAGFAHEFDEMLVEWEKAINDAPANVVKFFWRTVCQAADALTPTYVNYFTVTLVILIAKVVCLLVTIAYYTLAERKIMASVQRRLGPNVVGFWGLLQPLADGLKLFGKELVIPSHANSRIFIFAPMGVLGCAFLAWGVIPFHLFDYSVQMDTAGVIKILIDSTVPAQSPNA